MTTVAQATKLTYGEVELHIDETIPPLRSYWCYSSHISVGAMLALAALASALCYTFIIPWNALIGIVCQGLVLGAATKLSSLLPSWLWQKLGSHVERRSLTTLLDTRVAISTQRRIQVRGCAYDLAHLPVRRPFPFEPIVIRFFSRITQLVLHRGTGMALLFVVMLTLVGGVGITKPSWLVYIGAVVLLGLLCIRITERPSYLRIRPGYIEVMQFPVSIPGSPKVRELKLIDVCISIDYRSLEKFIVIESTSGTSLVLPRHCTRDPTEVAAAVIQGAICGYSANRVEPDSLVG